MARQCTNKYPPTAFDALLGSAAGQQLRARVDCATFLAGGPNRMICIRDGCTGFVQGPAADSATRSGVCATCAFVVCFDW